jgi:hypothetical protein
MFTPSLLEWVDRQIQQRYDLGGSGSGFFRHKGRPGKEGGSSPDDQVSSMPVSRRRPTDRLIGDNGKILDLWPSDDPDDPFQKDVSITFYTNMSGRMEEHWTKRQKKAIMKYTDGYYRQINKILRRELTKKEISGSDKEAELELNQDRKNIDAAFKHPSSVAPENFVAYRGLVLTREKRNNTIKKLQSAKDKNNLVIFQDKGYLSTSTSAATAQNFAPGIDTEQYHALLTIQVPKGAHILAPHNVSQNSGEQEIIFPHGTTFEILDYVEPKSVGFEDSKFDAYILMRPIE